MVVQHLTPTPTVREGCSHLLVSTVLVVSVCCHVAVRVGSYVVCVSGMRRACSSLVLALGFTLAVRPSALHCVAGQNRGA